MPEIYPNLQFPPAPSSRPAIAINMVTTIDGKTITGERSETVQDLGSSLDHQTMRSIEAAAQAVLIGAGTLRATPGLWFPSTLLRFVASGSGQLNWSSRFFTDAPESAFVATNLAAAAQLPEGVQCLAAGETETDWPEILRQMRQSFGIERLLVEGGSQLNAALLTLGVVDELFLTLAPKIKLGTQVPTYAGGDPLPRSQVQTFELVSCQPAGSEVFLRYRRQSAAEPR